MGDERERRIRERAYEIWTQRGGQGGTPEEDWLEAERSVEIDAGAARATGTGGGSEAAKPSRTRKPQETTVGTPRGAEAPSKAPGPSSARQPAAKNARNPAKPGKPDPKSKGS